jgi:hypothetical protein
MLVVTPTDTLDQPNTVLIGKKDQIVKLVYNEITTNYEQPSELLEAENNFFNKGASGNGNNYIINTTAGKLEVFDNINFTRNFIKTGYPVYHITANANGNNIYLYNKLNVDNTGIYSYNTETGTTTFLDFGKPIGDCIYNPFQDHFLISKLESDSAKIVIYNASTNCKIGEIDLGEGEIFAKEMFISPDGILYVMANMLYTLTPKIFIYDATTYSLIAGPLLIEGLTCEDDFIYYTAHFCSNPNNEDTDVYVSICPQEKKSPPYNTETNRMYDFYPHHENNGKLLRLDDGIIFQDTIKFPGKVIYPDRSQFGGNSQYDGRVFIIGKYLHQYKTSTNSVSNLGHYDFIDITYNAFHDKLFAFTNTPHDTCGEDRSCVIWTIEIDTSDTPIISEYNIAPIPGQAASFFSNPYNGKVYLHQKVDNMKLGDTQVSLHSFDPLYEDSAWVSTPLGITSFSPEYDQTRDPSNAQFYNITTPYIDPYDTAIYLPNGGHSCMSRVTFEPKELLLLRSGWTWLSYPRLERDGNDPVSAVEVLTNNIEPADFTEGKMTNLPPQSISEKFIEYINNIWTVTGYLTDVLSTRGYKLNLKPEDERTISLYGSVLDPSTQMDLYAGYANWIGFFPAQTMTVSEAFASIWDNISEIRHQDWAIANPSGNQPPVPDYMLNFTLSYGDMVIVRVFDSCTFQWPSNADPETPLSAPETQYFTYDKAADYTPFYVEMNPDSLPVEIAVYEDTICIGAAVVQDSIVEINGYLTDSLGYNPEISFISHYGLKSAGKTVKKYSVYNFKTNRMENRIIRSKDKADYYWISLKGGTAYENEEIGTSGDIEFKVYPNPFSNQTNFIYELKKPTKVGLYIYDTKGMRIKTLIDGNQTSGIYKLAWNGKNDSGKALQPGIYYYSFFANGLNKNGKLVIIE